MDLMRITEDYLHSLDQIEVVVKRDIAFEMGRDIVGIVGPRRVGKTHILLTKVREILESGKQALYVAFDNPTISDVDVTKLATNVRAIYPEGSVYLFLDEIQDWSQWDYNLRWLHDMHDFKIAVSGSTARLLSNNLTKVLRGRSISHMILPFSLREVRRNEWGDFRSEGKIKHELNKLMWDGGFPEVYLNPSKAKVTTLFETIFLRDVVEAHKVKNTVALKKIMLYLTENSSKIISYRSIWSMLKESGLQISINTIPEYISHLSDAFFVFEIPIYAYQKKQIISPNKMFVVDTSFLQLVRNRSVGTRMEMLVFLELLRRISTQEFEKIYYYKTKEGEEIDFVLESFGRKGIIEVTQVADSPHIKKVVRAARELKLKRAIIVSEDEEDYMNIDGVNIEIVPLWRFLLNKNYLSSIIA